MKNAIVSAIVAALVAGATGAAAATMISGRSIRPHSIPLNRLAHLPAGISNVQLVEGANVTVPAGSSTGEASAYCPAGRVVLGGGGYASAGVLYSSDESQNGHGWTVQLDNSAFTDPATLAASVICGKVVG